MTLLSRLIGKRRDLREPVRPLWHRIVEIAREKHWYAQCGVTDSISGRFDVVALVMALVLLRMERDPALAEPSVRLTELFVEDMDGQLRQSGVGDPTVGKHIGTLMGTLGGRLGAMRESMPRGEAALLPVLERNMTLNQEADIGLLAERTIALARQLEALSDEDLLAARIER